jgi:hypothetical protein
MGFKSAAYALNVDGFSPDGLNMTIVLHKEMMLTMYFIQTYK